jgi:hypothetical protein
MNCSLKIKKLTNKLDQAEDEIYSLNNKLTKQSIILNKIRETLLLKTDWNGAFEIGEDLSDIMTKYLVKRGAVCPPSEQ